MEKISKYGELENMLEDYRNLNLKMLKINEKYSCFIKKNIELIYNKAKTTGYIEVEKLYYESISKLDTNIIPLRKEIEMILVKNSCHSIDELIIKINKKMKEVYEDNE